MDDILFGNNNQATINRLAKRSYRANKQRNVFVTIALFLTAFMITSVFSLGCSYFETYQMQQIRAMGTTADVAITSLSEEQYEEEPDPAGYRSWCQSDDGHCMIHLEWTMPC